MKTLLLKYWDRLRSSFWFVPTAMACLAVALALSAVELDKAVTDDWMRRLGWSYSGGAEGASLLLSSVAGSMIAIAGTVFSMTLVALSLASSQLGPRLLGNFMRDTANQLVLGTFVATFVYCLLVLRTIRRADEGAFVPHISVSIGVLLAIVSVGVLIYFIHHISVSIQADQVVARVGNELDDGIDKLFSVGIGKPASGASGAPIPPREAALPAAFSSECRPVVAPGDGYLQMITLDALMELASEDDLRLRLECRPGHYLVKGQSMVMVWPGDRVTKALVGKVNAAFVLGNQRTATQDIEYPFRQLVEIAVRALSPGIHDPFTAITCIDRLESALSRLARRDMPSPLRFDPQGRLRLVAPGSSFEGIVDLAFNQIRQSAGPNPAVAIRMLDAIAQIAGHVQRGQDAACLQRHAAMIARGAREAVSEADDLRAVEACFTAATGALRGSRSSLHDDSHSQPFTSSRSPSTSAKRRYRSQRPAMNRSEWPIGPRARNSFRQTPGR